MCTQVAPRPPLTFLFFHLIEYKEKKSVINRLFKKLAVSATKRIANCQAFFTMTMMLYYAVITVGVPSFAINVKNVEIILSK